MLVDKSRGFYGTGDLNASLKGVPYLGYKLIKRNENY